MQKIFGLSVFLFTLLLLSFQASISSCSKDKTIYDTVTVIKKDTVVIKDTVLSLAILTASPWKLQELRGVSAGNAVYYKRGGTGNTQNFDNEYYTFRTDKTGTYTDANTALHPFTWDFANDARTQLTITLLNTPATYTITWDNIRYKNANLYYDEYYRDGNTGANAHFQGIRMPK